MTNRQFTVSLIASSALAGASTTLSMFWWLWDYDYADQCWALWILAALATVVTFVIGPRPPLQYHFKRRALMFVLSAPLGAAILFAGTLRWYGGSPVLTGISVVVAFLLGVLIWSFHED